MSSPLRYALPIRFREVSIRIRSLLIVTATLAAAASGCSSENSVNNPDNCNVRIVTVTPESPSLVVAHTLALHAAYTTGISASCVPSVPASSLIWVSTNPALLSVDSVTGVVTGHNTGAVSVTLHLPDTTTSLGSVTVNVTAE